jgi:hypothetical protein
MKQNVGDPDGPDQSDVNRAAEDINPAMEEASRRDEALVEVIRAELHGRPSHGTALTPRDQL